MNAFDDEPPLGGYAGGYPVPIDAGDGIPRRVAVRYLKERGGFARVSVSLEEIRNAESGALIRFDDAHGRFHRHAPGWPQPGDIVEFLGEVASRTRVRYAIDQIRARYNAWETDVFGREGIEL